MGIIFTVRNLLENNSDPLGFRCELWKSGRDKRLCLERLMSALWGSPDQTWKCLSLPLFLLSRKPGQVPSNIFSLFSFLNWSQISFTRPFSRLQLYLLFPKAVLNPITASYLILFTFMRTMVGTGTFIHTTFLL